MVVDQNVAIYKAAALVYINGVQCPQGYFIKSVLRLLEYPEDDIVQVVLVDVVLEIILRAVIV